MLVSSPAGIYFQWSTGIQKVGYKIWRNTQYLNLHRIYTNPSSSFKLCFQNRESLFLAGEILTSGVLPIPCIFENLWWNFHSDKHHLKNCDHKSTLNNNIEDMFTCIWKQMTFPKRSPDRKEIENPGLPKRKRSPKRIQTTSSGLLSMEN